MNLGNKTNRLKSLRLLAREKAHFYYTQACNVEKEIQVLLDRKKDLMETARCHERRSKTFSYLQYHGIGLYTPCVDVDGQTCTHSSGYCLCC